jgi:hypothetical protein
MLPGMPPETRRHQPVGVDARLFGVGSEGEETILTKAPDESFGEPGDRHLVI